MLQPFLTEIKFLLQNLSQTSKSKFKRYVQLTLLITIVNYHSPPSFPVGCTPAHPPTQWNALYPSYLVECTSPHLPTWWDAPLPTLLPFGINITQQNHSKIMLKPC